jgi:hypothetical protein
MLESTSLKKILFFSFPILIALLVISCRDSFSKTYTYNKDGYYYHLISYESETIGANNANLFKVYLTFQNQKDSVFWDSFNNYKDSFVIKNDSSNQTNILTKALYKFNTNDSGAILIRTRDFFKQQFGVNAVPFFAINDSLVKINFKIKEELTEQEFLNLQQELLRKEIIQIRTYLGHAYNEEKQLDSLGFYWIDRPIIADSASVKVGNLVTISYEASFLNGRFLEKSPSKFEFFYGTPDQILKGLNYVIPRLKIGENAKIILPSRLAFGENGSANGTVPPFTPLLYKIKLIDIKTK